MKRTLVGLLAAVVVLGVALAVAARGGDAPGSSLEDRVQAIASGLRCPVCQNLSVADSPSRLAGEMRGEIAERLRAGATDDEVRTFFVERYGDWVLLEPARRGLDLIPWLVPLVGLVVGAAIWLSLVRRRPRRADPETAVATEDGTPVSGEPTAPASAGGLA